RQALAPLVPRPILSARKRGFSIPAAAWLRGELAPLARELLAPSRTRSQGYFDPGVVSLLLREHLDRRRDHSRQLWGLMSFSLWAVLVTGAGRGFSSGADLKAGFDAASDGRPDVRKELHELYHPVIAGIRRLAKPVVAAVNGPAVGIGCSLALACDLVMAAESAFFGLAFVNVGLMPDGGSTALVPPAVGKARAFQMALLGERVPAPQALEWGLVNWVHPDERLMPEAEELVRRLAAGPTRSYASSKQALDHFLYGH